MLQGLGGVHLLIILGIIILLFGATKLRRSPRASVSRSTSSRRRWATTRRARTTRRSPPSRRTPPRARRSRPLPRSRSSTPARRCSRTRTPGSNAPPVPHGSRTQPRPVGSPRDHRSRGLRRSRASAPQAEDDGPMSAPAATAPLRDDRRTVLVVAILASFVVGLDTSVVNVALPAIRQDLGGGLVVQQWVVDAYLVTLGSLILVAGSLSDVFGGSGSSRGASSCSGSPRWCAPPRRPARCSSSPCTAGRRRRPRDPELARAHRRGVPGAGADEGDRDVDGLVERGDDPRSPVGGLIVDGIGWRWIFVLTAVPIVVTIVLVTRITGDVHPAQRHGST